MCIRDRYNCSRRFSRHQHAGCCTFTKHGHRCRIPYCGRCDWRTHGNRRWGWVESGRRCWHACPHRTRRVGIPWHTASRSQRTNQIVRNAIGGANSIRSNTNCSDLASTTNTRRNHTDGAPSCLLDMPATHHHGGRWLPFLWSTLPCRRNGWLQCEHRRGMCELPSVLIDLCSCLSIGRC